MARSRMVFKSTLTSKWVPKKVDELDADVLEIATVIHERAVILAPRDTSNLINSGRIERVQAAFYRIIFGSGRVPYALRRHFENKKNPHTLRYLERAGDGVVRSGIRRYIRRQS